MKIDYQPDHTAVELSYLDLCGGLINAVRQDTGIPMDIKTRVLKNLEQIESDLLPYSA